MTSNSLSMARIINYFSDNVSVGTVCAHTHANLS